METLLSIPSRSGDAESLHFLLSTPPPGADPSSLQIQLIISPKSQDLAHHPTPGQDILHSFRPRSASFLGARTLFIILTGDGERCVRPAGNASFSKRVQKSISQKKLKLDIDKSVRHLYICDFHKNFIQSVRNKRKRKTSDDGGDSPEHDADTPEVDLFQLQVNTLRRYKRHYKLQTRPGFNKAQLAETVSRHFRNIPVNEKETLAYFIYMVKSNRSRLDQKSEGSKQLE
uniref:histone deacetylase complex subunit SAP30L n=1 Tax=Myodes glareolus TaxID=447135 RepID=UPI00202154F6|nr:histone deacetylase complex subunit SAP30L [Myodes glareolus]